MFDINNLTNDYFNTVADDEILDIKSLSVEDKVKCFKFFFTSDFIKNVSVISNMFVIIDGVSSINEKDFENNKLFFNSLEEYVDIKLELQDEIKTFCTKLLEYYLGIIEGLDIKLSELKQHIPNTYFNVFSLVTEPLVSRLMTKYLKNIDVNNVKPAHCAHKLYSRISNPEALISDFIFSLYKDI